MVVHEVVVDYKVREVCAVNGGSYGGNRVNFAFIQLLKDSLGARFIERFIHECPKQWQILMRKFERAKKIDYIDKKGKTKKMSIDIPIVMAEMFNTQHSGNNFKEVINSLKEKGISFSKNGSLVLAFEVVEQLFMDTINHIIKGVQDLLDKVVSTGTQAKYMFMVGGFCDCSFLQNAVKQEFECKGIVIIIPKEAQLAIVKGAVLFGQNENHIVTRIARRTYGTGCAVPFDDAIHDRNCLHIDNDGFEWCNNIFVIFVEKGDEIEIGSCKEISFTYHDDGDCMKIYSLDRKPVQVEYTDNPAIEELGSLFVPNPKELPKDREIEVIIRMTFGSTEICVEAMDEQRCIIDTASLDFLSS